MTREEILAMEPGRKLDGYVDYHIFGSAGGYGCPNYSTDIATTWEVVEKMREKSLRLSICTYEEYFNVVVTKNRAKERSVISDIRAESAPLAICRAALLSLTERSDNP